MLMLKAKRGDDWYILDVYDEQAVNVNKQFTELDDINKPIGSFSLSFRLPATPTNREFFGVFYDANAINAINPKRKLEAVVEVDTIPVLKGFIQLKGTYTKINKYHEYEVVVFGELLSLREKSDIQLSELDWSDFDHELGLTAIQSANAGTLINGDVRYGCVERGQGLAAALQGVGSQNNAIYPASLTMFLRHKAIIDLIFDELGLTYESEFFESDEFAKYYTPLINGGQYTVPKEPLNNPLWAALDEDITFTEPTNNSTVLPLTTTAPFYDTSGIVTPATGVLNVPFDGVYTLLIYVSFEGSVNSVLTFSIVGDDNSVPWSILQDGEGDLTSIPQGQGVGTTVNIQVTAEMQLLAGVDYILRTSAGNFGGEFEDITIFSGTTTDPTDGTGVAILSASQPFFDYDVTPANNFPRMTIAQYLQGVQRCFNLLFIPDQLNPNKLSIEPFNDYMEDGVVIDWTEKLHIGKDKDDQIKPTTDIQKREIEFTFSDERDIVNEAYKDAGRTYGRFLIDDTENDFASGNLKVQSTFGAFPLKSAGGKLIHFAVNDSGKPVESRLKLAYFGGNIASQPLGIFDGTTNIINFPFFGHYSTPLPSSGDVDLNFGGELPQHHILANPTDNLFNSYWRKWVVELFSDLSRKRIAYFKLSALDIYNSKFNDRIWIADSYWRITKLSADVNSEELTQVELIKIIDVPPICNLTPSGVTNGVVTFNDAEGDPAAATEECCNAWNYLWTGTTCVQQSVAPQPQPANTLPPIIGGVELQRLDGGATSGFQLLTAIGNLGKVEVKKSGQRIILPYGSTMTFEADILVTEFDKANGITAIEKQRFQGYAYLQYDDASPDFTSAVARTSRMGDASGITLELTNSGNQLIFQVNDASNQVADCKVAVKLNYVLARN